VPLCMATVEGRVWLGGHARMETVDWHRMGLGSNLENPSTAVDGKLVELRL
jgi:hypothetical protein